MDLTSLDEQSEDSGTDDETEYQDILGSNPKSGVSLIDKITKNETLENFIEIH